MEREGNTRVEWERDSETAVARSLFEIMFLARPWHAPRRGRAFLAPGKTHLHKPQRLHACVLHCCARARTSAHVIMRLSVFPSA